MSRQVVQLSPLINWVNILGTKSDSGQTYACIFFDKHKNYICVCTYKLLFTKHCFAWHIRFRLLMIPAATKWSPGVFC